jgi:hypothetical protein
VEEKITAHEIIRKLLTWCNGSYDIVLPNIFHGYSECDVFRVNEKSFVYEYEVKISRSDFFADFKKETKHKKLKLGVEDFCPNRFFYVVPEGLVKKDEVPEYAGLIYYNDSFQIVKHAKLLHKKQFDNYKALARTVSFREQNLRNKLWRNRTHWYEKEISRLEKLNNKYANEIGELQMRLFRTKKEF